MSPYERKQIDKKEANIMMEHAPQTPQTTLPRLLVTVQEAAQMLGIGKTKMYELIHNGEIPVIHLDKMVRVDPRKLQQWVDTRKEEEE